jgi:hypothetical protein
MPTTSKLGIALRKKFKTPREALRALGLDQRFLDVPRLALDSASGGGTSSRAELEKLLARAFSGHEFQRAMELLNGALNADMPEVEQEESEDENDVDEEAERHKRWVADVLSRKAGLDDQEIAEALRDLPRNAIKGGMGGRLAERAEARDRKRIARDERRRAAFDERFGTSRLNAPSLIETSYGDSVPSRRMAVASDDFLSRFPGAARIGGPV